jgi:hypothetical protein
MKVSKSTQIADTMKQQPRRQLVWSKCITVMLGLCVCLIAHFEDVNAQSLGARSAGLGGAAYALTSDYWGVFGNPANLAEGRWVATSMKRSFGMSELDEPSLALGFGLKRYRMSFGLSTVGWDRFRIVQTSLAVASSIGNLTAGLALDVHHLIVPDPYLNDRAIQLNVGLQWIISDQISTAVSAGNINGAKWFRGQSELERNLRIGGNWNPAESVMIVLEGHLSDRFEADWITALEWMPIESFWLRSGFGSATGRLSFGLGVDSRHVKAGIFAQRHENVALGWTKGIELILARRA